VFTGSGREVLGRGWRSERALSSYSLLDGRIRFGHAGFARRALSSYSLLDGRIRFGHAGFARRALSSYSLTSMPIERAVPRTCCIAPSRSMALRSGSFVVAISFS
jgi:hypothetical protein